MAQKAETITAVRFAANPRIMVLDFPNLTQQGQAFNRMAAFLEKRVPANDHVLNNQELADAIREDRSTVETYYYGHDYRASDVARFFATVEQQNLTLTGPEQDLRALLTREGLWEDGSGGAVISIPRQDSDPFVDAVGRASLLRHELSHGEYFTNPAFARFVNDFWTGQMTDPDRAAFRAFLARQGYDPRNEDLIINEAQAHLVNTTDPRYFNAAACGLPAARLDALRNDFVARMPPGWLRDAILQVRGKLP
jgi:hypothetical protein